VWCPGCPVRPAVARTATVSSTPRAAVAVSGIVYGLWKPATAACGADVAPISSAAQLDQRRPAWHPHAQGGCGKPGRDQPRGRRRVRGRHRDEAAPDQVQRRRGEQQNGGQALAGPDAWGR
jgi:hypothetical protein